MDKMGEIITVKLEAIDDAMLCFCGTCRTVMFDGVPIGECVLAPSDPVPAGRCPICGNLVYPAA